MAPRAVPLRRRRGLTWMTAVAIVVVAAAALTLRRDRVHAPGPSPAATPDVLLITVDTLRPDALGWVAGKNATPEIDRLAGGAFRFPVAVAPVPLTLPSHAALLTGLLPRRLGLRDNGQVVPAGPRTLAEALDARGYATAAFVSGYPLDSAFGLDRGFDVYDDALAPGSDGELERRADATAAAALRWLAETGYLGAGLAAANAAALLLGLAVMKDRGRPFSRGFILLAGLGGFTLTEMLLSPAFNQPTPGFALAIMVGLALSYVDFESTKRGGL